MDRGKYWLSGILLLVVLTSSFYFIFDDSVKVDIQKTRTQYSINVDDSWKLAATEYVYIYDGTTKMRASSRELIYWNDSEYAYVQRLSTWKDNITTKQTYIFDIYNKDITQYPLRNKLECINCEGKFIQFEIRDILYDGETKNIKSPFNFGNNMKIEWQPNDDFSWAKVYQNSVASDKIIVKFKADEQFEEYNVRLFDPPEEDLIISSGTTTLGGNQVYRSVYVAAGATLAIDSTYKFLNLTVLDNITILGTINGVAKGYAGGADNGCTGDDGLGEGPGIGGGCYDSSDNYGFGGGGAALYGNGGNGGRHLSYGQLGAGGTAYFSSPFTYPLPGSGGGASGEVNYYGVDGATGGGGLRIVSPIIITGSSSVITTNGNNGIEGRANSYDASGGSGGGSAGTIIIEGFDITLDGTITSKGGNGGDGNHANDDYCGQGGGGAAGGAIIIKYQNSIDDTSSKSVSYGIGGTADGYSCTKVDGNNGAPGLIQTTQETIFDISLISPESDSNIQNLVNFTCISDLGSDITLNIDEEVNVTEEGTISVLYNISEGNHTYYCNTSIENSIRFDFIVDDNSPTVNALSPIDNFITNITNNNFTINLSDLYSGIGNVSIYTNYGNEWQVRELNQTMGAEFNVNVTFMQNTQRKMLWFIKFCDLSGNCNYTENRTIHLDYYNPSISILYPLDESYITNVSDINYTVSDDYPNKCWYSIDNGVTNSTDVDAGTNFTDINSSLGSNTISLYCNDTRGNIGSASTDYYLDAIRYNSSSEQTNASFTINAPIINNLYNITTVSSALVELGYPPEGFDPGLINFNNDSSNYAEIKESASDAAYIKYGDLDQFYTYTFGFNTETTYSEFELTDFCKQSDSFIALSVSDTDTPEVQVVCINSTDGMESILNITTSARLYNYSFTSQEIEHINQVVILNPLLDFKNISYNYYNLTNNVITINNTNEYETNITSDNYIYNFTPIYWNTEVYDTNNISYTLPIRYKGIENIALIINGSHNNLIAELGTNIIINATSDTYNVSLDINHPDYGINYITDFLNVGLDLVINYFRRITFIDYIYNYEIEYNAGIGTDENKTFNISAHQYDEIDNISINISGIENPLGVAIYKVNTSEYDRVFYGNLTETGSIKQNRFTDYNTSKNLAFDNKGTKYVYFLLDDAAQLISFVLDISSISYGFLFTDDFETDTYADVVLSNASYNGLIRPGFTEVDSFLYDNFSSASINDSLWTYTADTSISAPGSANGYDIITTSSILESAFYSYIDADLEPDGSCYENDVNQDIINQKLTNMTSINLYAIDGISFSLDYSFMYKERSNFPNEATSGSCYNEISIKIGNTQIWAPYHYECEPIDEDSCDVDESSISVMSFNITRVIGNKWNVDISGTEYMIGLNDVDCDDSTSYTYWDQELRINEFDTCSDYNETLNNNFDIIVDPTNAVLNIDTNANARYRGYDGSNDGCYGCSDITAWTKLYNVSYIHPNYLNNTIYYSTSVFDSSYDVSNVVSNITYTTSINGNDSILEFFISGNNGDYWQNIVNGVNTPLLHSGKNMKWSASFELANSGYTMNIPVIYDISLQTQSSNVSNVTFDFGGDGIIEHTINGNFMPSNDTITVNLSSANLLNSFPGAPVVGHTYSVPLVIGSDSAGIINIDNIDLEYNPNPIILDVLSFQNYLNTYGNAITIVPIILEASGINAIVNITNLLFDYAGGNETIEILTHNADYSINDTLNITYYYSRWDYEWVPNGVEWIYFAPNTPTSENVTPYGQTDTVPILNITNYGYGGLDAKLSIYQDGLSECVNTTISLTPNKEDGVLLNESWVYLSDMSYLETQDIYLWSDYSCDYSTWSLFQPQYYFKMCVDGGACSTEII